MLAEGLGWSKLALHWTAKSNRSPWEPLLGWSTLTSFADGFLKKKTGLLLAPREALPRGRQRLVVTFAWSMYSPPNLTQIIDLCVDAAARHSRPKGCLLMAVGDAPFPPRNFEWTNGKEVRAWATNLAPDADVDRVTAMPLGVSAGPNRAWARTVRSQLADGADATFDQRDHLFLCNGYRNDSSRQAALDAVALAGFDNCDSTDRAGVVEYWRRLKSAKTTFCPRGFGTATFRATEALLAGSVPVMESYEKHDAVFSTLPVILTQKNFKQMDDPARLDQIWRDIVYRRNLFDMRPIFAPYWIAKLAEASHN